MVTVGHVILTGGQRIRPILRVLFFVDTKICGVALNQMLLLVFKAMDFICDIFSWNNFIIKDKQSKLGPNNI